MSLPSFDSNRALELLRAGTQNPSATFRDGQEEAIRHVVEGRGRLLVVEKTGWGKSSALTALLDHAKGGSDVRVLANHHNDRCWCCTPCRLHPASSPQGGYCETKEAVWGALHNAGIPWGKVGTHSKILIVSGPLKEGGSRSSVYTGSTNFSQPSNQPDAWVGVHNDASIFDQYNTWWKWLCSSTAMSVSGSSACLGPQKKS